MIMATRVRCRRRPEASGGALGPRQPCDDGVVRGVDEFADLVVGDVARKPDGVPAVPPDVAALADRLRVALAPVGGFRGVPAALDADSSAPQPDEGEALAADLGHQLLV